MAILLSHGGWGMPTVPIDVAVEHCARLGFDGYTMAVKPGWTTDAATLDAAERRRILALFDRYGLELAGISGQTSLLPDDPDQVKTNLALVHGYIDLTAQLQRPGHPLPLCMTAGGRPDQWEEAKHLLVDRFGELARHAEQAGVIAVAEPHVSSALRDPADVLWLLDQVGSPALMIDLNTSHFNTQGLDIERVIEQLGPRTARVEVKDERGLAPDHELLVPGEGTCDYVKILKALQRVGYDGFVDVEISFMVQHRPGYDPLAVAEQSYRVLASAFEEAGIERRRRWGQSTA
jgi:L-ribulose-5-phosphate 3-epimerase